MARTYTEDNGLPSSSAYSIAQDARGLLWFATRQGVATYDGAAWAPYNDPGTLPLRETNRIAVDPRGRVWFLSRSRSPWLAYREGEAFVAVPDPENVSAEGTIRLSLCLLEGAGGQTAAVGTASAGLFLWSGGSWRHLTTRDGLPGNEVRALAADGDRLWVGTSGGLALVRDGAVDPAPGRAIATSSPGIMALAIESSPPTNGAAADGKRLWIAGTEWLGTLAGGAFTLTAGGFTMATGPINPGTALWDGIDTLFFGSYKSLFAYDTAARRVRPFGRSEGLIADGATALFQDRERSIWVAGVRGVSKIPSRRFANFRAEQGLLDDEVAAICEPRPGVLVLGHNRGLTVLDGDSIRTLPFAEETRLPGRDPRVLECAVSADGSVWLAASEYGLGRLLPNGELRWYGDRLGLAGTVVSVAMSVRGSLLVSTQERVVEIDPVSARLVTAHTAQPGGAVRRIVPGPTGELAVATYSGGVQVLREGAWHPVDGEGPGETRNVYCALRDSRGRYWVGTNAGLLDYAGDRLRISAAPEISRPVYFIVEDRRGALWIGTDRGVVRWDGERSSFFSIREGLAGPETNRAAGFVDSLGRVWIGTNRGLSRYQPEHDAVQVPPPAVEILPAEVNGKAMAEARTTRLPHDQNGLTFRYRVLSFVDEDAILVRSRLAGFESAWSPDRPAGAREMRYTNLPPGTYRFLLRARSATGVWSEEVSSPPITILPPFWRTWWFAVLALLAAGGLLTSVHRFLAQRRYTVELAAEVRRRTDELRASEERYRHLFHHAGAVKLLLDAGTGAIADANEAACEFYGHARDDLLGRTIGELAAQTPAEIHRRLREASEQPRSHWQSRHRLASGEQRDVEIHANPLEIDGQRLIHLIVHDVTEKRRLEEERHRAGKLESIGLLAGGIAHDFNNILAAISGFIAAARLRVAPDHEVLRTLDAAETAAVRATRLTKQLLTFAKGGAPVKRVASLAPIIREAAGFALVGSNVRCEFSLPASLWDADVDEGQFGQVIHNLVLNAAQAMPAGGVIAIAAANVTRSGAGASPPALPAGEFVEVTVSDRGTGIPPEALPRIFDPYFTTKPAGSGLGLATAYSIVKAHGGSLDVRSEPGVGTTLTIQIPASRRRTDAVPQRSDAVVGGSGRVLIMDDEDQVRDAYREVLTLLGYDVVLARDGGEAIERYAEAFAEGRRFSAVILDLTVPGGLGGRETIRELAKLDPDVRAIVASGYVDDSVLADPHAAGFAGVLTKPFTIGDLDSTLRMVTARTAEAS